MDDTTKPLVNKVAQKALITIDLEQYFPGPDEVAIIDLKDFLFKGLILREADFRELVKNTDWTKYKNKYVAICCTANAIVPMWAYMVLAAETNPFAKDIAFATPEKAADSFLLGNLSRLDFESFKDKRVVIKGCSDRQVPEEAFVFITKQLSAVARVVMYGEPCSTVPVFKKSID